MTGTAASDRVIDVKAALAVGVTMVLWSSAFVAIRYAGADLHPGSLALGRLVIGAVALAALLVVRGEGLPPRAAWPGIVAVGLFWFGVYTVALNWGERHADAGTAALIVGIGPILVALLGGRLLNEGFPRPLLAGLAIAFAGSAVVGLAGGGGESSLWGVLLCLVAAVGYAIGVVGQKRALAHASALQVTTFGCALGAAACLPFAGQLVSDVRAAPGGATLAMVYLGLLPTAVAFWTWAYALTRMTAGRLGATTYVVPVLVVLLSWALLDEVPTPLALAGGALCLLGVAVSRRRPRPPAPTPAATVPATGRSSV
ncbi:membrane protein [Sphaerisporangium krabiense]|uniref:Drug/metabolite transporter (DMT)-like permease n=1 Tax=Sphaerisporangium krabiense TaxID=763782 RepID=A0A7W8Z8X7_9ACTN|nr:DMT family transporter [Sphaerisporangium krabiense]MBB5629465.1 drug/metabolite transporter (DMT)-like permease [Sphaerisporangium krabiense]GII65685.1 membrane protein [Sphaerisporangium krabiense]